MLEECSRDPLSSFPPRAPSEWFPPGLFCSSFSVVGIAKPGTKMKDCGGVNLRNPRFYDIKDESDLPHGRFLAPVQTYAGDDPLGF
jgi:hypothetical protein